MEDDAAEGRRESGSGIVPLRIYWIDDKKHGVDRGVGSNPAPT